MNGRALRALDVLICVALIAFGVSVSLRSDLANGTIVDTLLLPAAALPILIRRTHPLGSAGALLAGTVISGIPTFDQFRLGVVIPAGILIAFSVGSRCERRPALEGLALVLAAMVFDGATDRVVRSTGGVAGMVLFSFPLCLISWAAGRTARARDRMSVDLRAQADLLTRQRQETAQLAVEVERDRLAFDLDLAARARVREMIDLAQEAELSLIGEPDATRATFAQIERLGRDALNEMRGLLGVLRSDERGARAPRPTLAQIESLLERARGGGGVVDLELLGERRELPAGLELATYRVLQHALLAVASSADEPAMIRLQYLPDALELEVQGPPRAGAPAEAAVVAARERVMAQGGRFTSELPGGTRRLWAVLPVAMSNA